VIAIVIPPESDRLLINKTIFEELVDAVPGYDADADGCCGYMAGTHARFAV
jgi:hypothetical protein